MLDPHVTGRSVVVAPGTAAPEAWRGCERVVVAEVSEALADRLLDAWRRRIPLVIELHAGLGFDDPDTPPPTVGPADAPPWEWSPDLRLLEDEIHHGIWANAVDARGAQPTSRWLQAAVALGCAAVAGGAFPDAAVADVLLPDGTPAIWDGGPLDSSLGERLDTSATGVVAVLHRVGLEHNSLRPLTPTGADAVAFPLAPDQLAAGTSPHAGARVIAPAGSGKTRVLTERARLLLAGWGLPAGAMALVAYNVRAREELQERLANVAAVRIRTLNALSLRLTGDVRTIDERDARSHLSQLVAVPRRADADPLAVWLEALTRVRLGLLDPREVEAELPDVAGLDEIARSYRERLAKRGEVDFDEQVVRAIARLLGEPAFRFAAQRSARVLLVDEFQDLTPAHLLLLRLLSGPAGAVFGVGDDDQTIYGYAGASPEWLVGFQHWFPGSAEHALEVNYRCAPAVVQGAANLLTRNGTRVAKEIRPRPERATTDGALDVRSPSAEPAAASADAVRDLTAQRGASPQDVAVLCRVNAQLAPVVVLLRHHGIPVRSPIDERFLARSTVRAALAWCALSAAPTGSPAWKRLDDAARRPRRGMSESLRALAAKKKSVDDLRALAQWLEGKGSVREADKIGDLAGDVDRVRAVAGAGTETVLRVLRDEIGLATSAATLDSWSHGSVSSHEDDLDALVALAHLHPDPVTFERWLREQLSAPNDDEGVTLASVHAVKGREWPYVVVHHASEGLLPHRLVEDIEEERRVFHVAITRSSIDTIVVPGPKPSSFLPELRAPGAPPRAQAKHRADLRRTPEPAPKVAPADQLDDEQRVLYDALRAWRTEVIRGTKKPAYTVMTDATLSQIAAAQPTDERGLARVPGIGPSKLEQYGDAILALVQAHAS